MNYQYVDQIEELCQLHTNSTAEEISTLKQIAYKLLEDNMNSDKEIFIDVKDKLSNEAVVIFHRHPLTHPTIYKKKIVGEIAFRKDEPGTLRSLETGIHSLGLFAQTQEGVLIKQDVSPIFSNKKVLGVLIIEEDLTGQISESFDLMKTGTKTEEIQSIFSDLTTVDETIYNNLSDIILIFDEHGTLKYYNRMAVKSYQKFGYKNKLDYLHYDNLSLDNVTFDQVLYDVREMNRTIMESKITFNEKMFSIKKIFLSDKKLLLLVMRELFFEVWNESIQMRNYMEIQEIHHRVKNNLQSIVSILRLQARRYDNKEVQLALMESVNRVLAIAATHELLSKQKDNDVQIALVLERVLTNLKRVYMSEMKIVLQADIDDSILLDSDRSVALCLVVNEAIQNSFEHAFSPETQDGLIELRVVENNTWIEVFIKDNGCGFLLEETSQNTLGLQIIEAYVTEKLSGSLAIDSQIGTGTQIKIQFNRIGS